MPAKAVVCRSFAQVLVELIATRSEERGSGSRYTSLAILESIKWVLFSAQCGC